MLLAPIRADADKRVDVPGYSFSQITRNGYPDRYPRVSASGLITWVGGYNHDPAAQSFDGDLEVMVWDGVEIQQITDNDIEERRPVINDFGDIAFMRNGSEYESEIIVYTADQEVAVTSDLVGAKDRYPDINDTGWVVWARLEPTETDYRIALYNLNTPATPWQLLGWVGCWTGYFGACYRPHVNALDHIEFRGRNIWGTNGLIVQLIPAGMDLGYAGWRRSELNDLDQLAIEAAFPPAPPDSEGPRDILFWDGAAMSVIFRSPIWVGRADLNNAGVVAFEGFGGLPGSLSGTADSEIFVYNPELGTVIQLTDDDDVDDAWPTITADGSIVWTGAGRYPGYVGYAGDLEIFQAVPTGDADGDGIADAIDNCPLEPNTTQADSGGVGALSPPDGVGNACQCGDLDGSGWVADVDLLLMRTQIAGLASPPLPERCSVAGFDGPDAGACDLLDVALLTRALDSLGPGLAQLCAPAHAWQ